MEWNESKDLLLCHEVLQIEPYKMKEKTVNRAQAWKTIADKLTKQPARDLSGTVFQGLWTNCSGSLMAAQTFW